MTDIRTIAHAAAYLSAREDEIVDVTESPAGTLIATTDGNTFVIVPDDRPDGAGRTGLMFVTAPQPVTGGPYLGGFPIYTNPPDAPDTVAGLEDDVAVRDTGTVPPTKDELLARAAELGLDDVRPQWGIARITDAIAAAEQAATEQAATDADGDDA